MPPRQTISHYAHVGLSLALIFMVLEVEHIGKLWGVEKMSHEFLVTFYCGLLVAAMLSFLWMAKTVWGWLFVLPMLFVYSGCAIPEGVEDLREILRALFKSSEGCGVLLLRLAFTLFLAVPFLLFGWLAVVDVCGLLRKRKGGVEIPNASDKR